MKIKLLTYSKVLKDVYLNTPVVLRTPRTHLPVDAIIDTGNPTTILGYNEAVRLQVPIKNLEKIPKTMIMGGCNNELFKSDRAMMIFISEDGQRVVEQMPIAIAKPTSNVEQPFSLIIGTDFLKNKGYTLFCDLKNDNAYLEKEDTA